MTTKENKTTVVASAQQLSAGVGKHLANATQVSFAGGSYTPAQITSKLQQIVTLRSDVDAAKATTKAKLATEKADMPALRTFLGALVAYVKAVYATQPDVLADFGIAVKARATPSVETKAAASVKRAATRAARNTMGSKQKKAVKGAVIGVTITPTTATQPTGAATAGGPSASATSTDAKAATTATHTP